MIDDNPMLIHSLHYCCYYSGNLTFPLAPGWAFVESEDWRKDVQCAWSGCGGDAGMSRYFFCFCFPDVDAHFFLGLFSRCFALPRASFPCIPLPCAPPQTAGHIPTTHGSVRDLHRISLVGGASREGGGG